MIWTTLETMAIKQPKLTELQRRFVLEYVEDFNGKEAAIRAGYSPKSAKAQASALLANPIIQTELTKAREAITERVTVTVQDIVAELARVAFFDVRTLFDEAGNLKPVSELDDNAARALAGIDVVNERRETDDDVSVHEYTKRIKVADKLKALEMLGKYLGMFTDTTNVNQTNVTVQFFWPENGRDVPKVIDASPS